MSRLFWMPGQVIPPARPSKNCKGLLPLCIWIVEKPEIKGVSSFSEFPGAVELNDLHLGTCLWGSKARRVTSIITSTVLCKREFFTLLASAGCGGIFPLLSQWTVIVPGIKDGDVPVVNLLSQVTCKSQAWLYLCKAP